MGSNKEALLSVRNLSIGIRKNDKLYSSVEDISFDIYPGEILGLVGESGSGKSLTALSIAGLLDGNKEVTRGSILLAGAAPSACIHEAANAAAADSQTRDLLRFSEKELEAVRGKEISMIFQEPFSSLNPLKKIGSQVAETMILHGEKDKGRIKKQVIDLMIKLKLGEPGKLIKTYPHRLSGGMCQRVMIALAIINRPRLLVADEPTTALDQNTQGQILSLLKEINRDLCSSILFISHDLGLVKDFCSRVLVMYSGRILEEGNTEEIFNNPAHEYTKGLLRSIPVKANRGKDLAAIPGRIPSLEEGRPKGCPFHPRCEKAMEACKSEFPPARQISATHKTRCTTGDKK